MTRRRRSDGGRSGAASDEREPPGHESDDFAAEGSEPEQTSKSSSTPSHPPLACGLYVVATPIGHLGDVTRRALQVLGGVDEIACEDTRVTARLLSRYGIRTRLTRYDEHTAGHTGPALVDRMAAGARVALVSDAGTPLISDPGERLVRQAIDAALPVVPIPGPSAVLTALCVSGLPTRRFLFAGFLAPRAAARRQELVEVAAVPATLVFLEAAPRLAAALADMADVLGPRPAAVARELTKLFEEVRRGLLPDLATHYRVAGAPKGEVTVVVGPPAPAADTDAEEADRLLVEALARLSPRDAVSDVAHRTGLPRRALYARAMVLKEKEAPE